MNIDNQVIVILAQNSHPALAINSTIMESKQVNEIFERVSNSILSSNSLLQLETAERLLELFRQQNSQPELSEKLNLIFVNKAETLHYFEWKRFRDCGLVRKDSLGEAA